MAIAITPEMLALIDRGDLAHDPIARQFVPSAAETEIAPDELADPIGDEARSPVKGIVHRYPDRVLLKPLHVCPVYCRFCFRREKVGPGGEALSAAELAAALAYIRDAAGDLGSDPDRRRSADAGAAAAGRADRRDLDAIDHVGVIRIHSRVPIVDPGARDRRTGGGARPRARHAVARRALQPRPRARARRRARRSARLADAGIPADGPDACCWPASTTTSRRSTQLMRALVTARVKPYYLHHPDLVRGTGHFRVSVERGQALMKALRGRLSGLAQPTYVLDVPGGHGKVPIGPAYLGDDPDALLIEDAFGGRHRYPR